MSFERLLIVNRGEIAVRIIYACRELGLTSISVYSEADEGAMHHRLADVSCFLGPAPATESYLNVERLVEIIVETGAEAVHPGYGFLAESAAFARAVEAAGAVWVGPTPAAMDAVGFKVRAKELASRAGVPTVPGYDGADQSDERLAEEAERIGYPVLVKASAGGGGRGMREVKGPGDFAEALRGARREAEAAFGDGSVFLERLIERPRHVEVQVIGDQDGNVIHLFERECSIQRRHQKVVEESPSPALDAGLRNEICSAAVRLAREAGYTNAGTVEFLLEGESFFFLEMNARLQVEHPVTELVTGLDLVHLQLAVAAGDPLPLSQDDVTLRGSAVEARLYAEDEDGLPAGGRLLAFAPPEGPGIRNDAGFEAGDEVSLHYDSMLSKLIVYSPDRPSTVRRLRRALRDYEVLGLPTNLPLLRRIAETPAFAAGETSIRFLDEHRLTEPQPEKEIPPEALMLAAAGDLSRSPDSQDPFSAGPWRLFGAVRLRYRSGEKEHTVEAGRSESGMSLSLAGRQATVEVLSLENGRLSAVMDGEAVVAAFASEGPGVMISYGGEDYELRRSPPPGVEAAGPGGADAGGASLTAPMPGTVVRVMVDEGDDVEEGQTILVLEAMKMEQPVVALYAGRVSSLPYAEGSLVPGGAVLAEIEEPS